MCGLHDDAERPAQHLQQRPAGMKICVLSLLRKSTFCRDFCLSPAFCPCVALQEDKEAMFDCYDNVQAVLQVTTGVMSTLKVTHHVHCLF